MKRLLIAALAAALLAAPVRADEIRYQYDENFPSGPFSLDNWRATLRGLHQMDMMPLRPRAKRTVDGLEYSANAAIQAQYSGSGVTVTSEDTIVQEGSYSLKAVIDATDNRTMARTFSVNLDPFLSLTLWERSSQSSDTFQFYVEDSGGNQSYWDLTADASAGTWVQHTLTLASPDGNNGTDADLSDIVEYGFQSLTASTTYYLDTIKAIVGLTVVVQGTDLGSYYRHVYLGAQPMLSDAQAAPAIIPPSTNPRIDILTVDSSGTLAWVAGSEASTPVTPWASLPANKIPICTVYQRVGMTKILAYEDKDTDTNQGYILADVRPFLNLGLTTFLGMSDSPASYYDQALKVVRVNSGATGLEFADLTETFTGLTDTPNSYSGQALRYPRVAAGATGIEFVNPTFLELADTPASYTANKFLKVNSSGNAIEQATLNVPTAVSASVGLVDVGYNFYADVVTVNKTITSGSSVFVQASCQCLDRDGGDENLTGIRIAHGATNIQEFTDGLSDSGNYGLSRVVTGLSGAVTFRVQAKALPTIPAMTCSISVIEFPGS